MELQNLESPFNWNMEEIKKTIETDNNTHDDEEFLPLLKFIRNIMVVYVDVTDGQDFNSIKKCLEKSKENFAELKKISDPEISTEAVFYVLKSTEGFVYSKFGMKDELEKVFTEIDNSKLPLDNEKFKSTLIGCKSIGWSLYRRHGAVKAEKYIRQAINLNPNCHLWHFILAKNLRRLRKDFRYGSKPSREETECFIKCYDLFENPTYGTFVAQMYREKCDYDNAILMYERIHKTNPESATILLRLALGFISSKKYALAKDCLDKVAEKNAFSSMYFHYMGIYHMKMREYRNAASFLKEAMKDNNLPAEKYYVTCMVNINKNFDVLSYLLQMVEKYNKVFPEKEIQSILLDIAFLYWKRRNQIDMAVKYFYEAINIDPKAGFLTNYLCDVGLKIPCRNVYVTLRRDFLPIMRAKLTNYQTSRGVAISLKKYCDEYFDRQSDELENNFSKLNFNK